MVPPQNFVFVHGTYRSKERYVPMRQGKGWMTWAKAQLEKEGREVYVPDMPSPWVPTYGEWKMALEGIPIHTETTLVGHSAGAGFVVRWLGDTKTKIKKLILVAPGKIIQPDAPGHNRDLYDFSIDTLVNELANDIVIFASDKEPVYRQENIQLYMKILKAKLIVLPNHGHFTFTDMQTEEFPELIKELGLLD